jgi:hypothetical protein
MVNNLTTNPKSGSVNDGYCREPTVLRYREGSSIGSPAKADKTKEAAIGDVIGLASNMFVFFNKFRIYLHWGRSRLDLTLRTSIPRK